MKFYYHSFFDPYRRNHQFSTYAKFFQKLTFLTPWYAHERVSGGKKCYFFGKFCVRTQWTNPYWILAASNSHKSSLHLLVQIQQSKWKTIFWNLFKFNNKDTWRTTIMSVSYFFFVSFEHILEIVLIFPLLTLNK